MFNIKENFNMFAFGRVGWNLAIVALLAVWVIAIQQTNNKTIQDIQIDVDSIEGMRDLIVKDEMLDVLNDVSAVNIKTASIKKLDIRQIEAAIKDDNRVHDADIYIDAQHTLHVNIEQRRPILRFKGDNGQDYYLDQGGSYVSKSQYRAVRVPIVTGYFNKYQPNWTVNDDNRINKAYEIGSVINKDDFLRSLIEQIHFERSGRIVLVPKVGEHKIVLDYMDNLERKLSYNLKRFYKQMAKDNMWGKYDELDISYKNQIVGRTLEPQPRP